jgi:hypothetical protein
VGASLFSTDKKDYSMSKHFDWAAFVHELDPEAWSKLAFVWTPQGIDWVQDVVHESRFTPEAWRAYAETSVRYGIYRHFIQKAAAAAAAKEGSRVVMPIITPTIISRAHSRMRRDEPSAMRQVYLSDRTRQWVPELEYTRSREAGSPLVKSGTNMNLLLSDAFCTDLMAIHMSSAIERRLLNAIRKNWTFFFWDSVEVDENSPYVQLFRTLETLVTVAKGLLEKSTLSAEGRRVLRDKLDTLKIAFSSEHYPPISNADLNELYGSTSFMDMMMLSRKQSIVARWRDFSALSLPPLSLFDSECFYDGTENTLVLSAGLFTAGYFLELDHERFLVSVADHPSLSVKAHTTFSGFPNAHDGVVHKAFVYGRLFSVVVPELVKAFSRTGLLFAHDGSTLGQFFWKESTLISDGAHFDSNEQCVVTAANQFEKGILPEEQFVGFGDRDALVRSQVSLVMMETFLNIKRDYEFDKEARRIFWLSWAQSICTKQGNRLDEKDSAQEDFFKLSIDMPFQQLVGADQFEDCFLEQEPPSDTACSFF